MAPIATTPTLGGTSLRQPKEFSYSIEYRGGIRTMADGSTITDLVNANAKRVFTLRWDAMTATEKDTLITAFAAIKTASGTFLSPENVSYTVTRHPDQHTLDFGVSTSAGGTEWRYSATLRLREV